MKCPICGNELDPNEVFCGQCGAPTRPTGLPTEMVQTPPARGQINSPYNTQVAPGTTGFNGGNPNAAPIYTPSPNPNQPVMRPPSVPQQQGDFYQDATEAMSVMPNQAPAYPAGYPQQGYTGIPIQGGMPGASQFGQPPVQTSNFGQPGYPQTPIYPPGQGYGSHPNLTPPPKQNHNVVLIIAIICLACAIIAVSSFGILYLVHKNSPKAVTTPTPTVTTAPSPTPSPTLSPSPTPSPSPSPSPSPTLSPSPTATPDAGFSFCDTPCLTNGFQVESPNGWEQSQPDATSIKFQDPQQTDAYATFKTPGPTTSDAPTLIKNELAASYASLPGYSAPTTSFTTKIGGQSWTYETASYQLNGATEQVQVYAYVDPQTNKAYIIDLEWPSLQFATFFNGYFQPMLNSFQFQAAK